MKNVTLVGIDLSKEVFEVRCENRAGRLVSRREVGRGGLIKILDELPRRCTIAIEACGSSHYWAHEFEKRGFKVKLLAPQFVRAFRRSQKNDVNDAEAICTAARQPGIRCVSVKSFEQLDIQMAHRVKERVMKEHTALMNQIRGFLFERGFVVPKGVSSFRRKVRELLEVLGSEVFFGALLQELWSDYLAITERLDKSQRSIKQFARKNEDCRKLERLVGVGPIVATSAVALIGRPLDFKNGRAFAASIGVVPRQFSTGGKPRLGSITKCGDSYFRKNLIHGARSAVRHAVRKEKTDPLSLWIRSLHQRYGTNHTSVALANKTARHIWAVLAGKEPLPELLPKAA